MPGPCPECAEERPHYCSVGERLRDGTTLHVAIEDAIVETFFVESANGIRLTRERAEQLTLDRLCKAHRRVSDIVLQSRREMSDRWPRAVGDAPPSAID